MPVLIEKLRPNGTTAVLAAFNDAEYAASRLDCYGDPGTCSIREVRSAEAKASLRKGFTHPHDIQFVMDDRPVRAARAARATRRAKLDETKVRAIRVRAAQGGVTNAMLASEYSVSRATISYIVSRRSWAHVL